MAGAVFSAADNSISLSFIGKDYRVSFPGALVLDSAGSPAALYPSILILHYLVSARGTPLGGQWIAYRHLPGGDIYNDPFQKRAVQPFLKTFGARPGDFVKAARSLGAAPLEGSSTGMIIPVLPRVPLLFMIWPGDDELPATANILFDSAAADYLPTEDYAHLPALVLGELKKLAG